MSKEIYERPVIIRHYSGLANKFGKSRSMATISHIDGISVKDIAKKHGTPVFIFSEKTIRKTYNDAYRAFSMRYPKIQFTWSYKTNYLDAVCRIFHDLGSHAEVVSEYEYEMAIRNGVPGNKISYNGPYKPYEHLKKAVKDGAKIHIDHYDELLMLERIATEENITINIAMRLNMDTGIHPRWDRFGFNYDNGEAMSAARRISAGGKLKLNGIHSHIGTFILDPAAYKKQISKMAEFAKDVEQKLKFKIDYLDIGGGFPSTSTLHSQYSPGEEINPKIEEYAEAITSALLEADFSPDALPTLYLETGRALIDSAGYMLTSVIANKRLANGTASVIIDAGLNILFTSFWYKHNVYPVEEKTSMPEETIIYGPLCMNIDVIRPSIKLPAVNVEELLVIAPVGAYNVTQWMQFIRMRPSVLLIGENGEIDVIRTEENVDTIKNHERIPDRFKNKKIKS